MACQAITTKLSVREGEAILLPYVEAVRDMFLGAGLDRVKLVQVKCSKDMHDSPRHFAGTNTNGRIIMLAPEMVELGEDTVTGVVAHEFGHAVDFLYPAEFAIRGDTVQRRDLGAATDKQHRLWQRAWSDRDDDVVEKTADLIAGLVWGKPIGYAGPCMLETFAGGVPRPVGLR